MLCSVLSPSQFDSRFDITGYFQSPCVTSVALFAVNVVDSILVSYRYTSVMTSIKCCLQLVFRFNVTVV